MHEAPTIKLPQMEVRQDSPQPKRASSSSSSGLPLWMYALFTVLILTVVALGYRLGYNANDTKKSGFHRSLRLEADLRNRTANCEIKRQKLYKEKKSVNQFANAQERQIIDELESKIEELRDHNEDLFKNHKSLVKKNQRCEDEYEVVRKQREDASKVEVDILTEKVKREEAKSKLLANENAGARRILLLQVLQERRARNYKLRHHLGIPLPSDDRDVYETKLIAKHKIAEKADGFPDDVLTIPVRTYTRRRLAQNLLDPSKNGGLTNLTLDDAILAITSNWEQFKYDPNVHTDIFFTPTMQPFASGSVPLLPSEFAASPPTAEETQARADALAKFQPSYFGRTGNAPPVKGVLENTQLVTLSLAQLLRIIVRTSFCALRTNNTNFIVPFQFKRPADPLEPVVQSATLVVATPLINFCMKCSHTIQTKEFKLACEKSEHTASSGDDTTATGSGSSGNEVAAEKVTSVYGSYDFWRTRSRVRFSQKVVSRADDEMRKRGIAPNTTLAVDFKRSSKWEAACNNFLASKTLPLKHYMWMFGNVMRNNNINNKDKESTKSSEDDTGMRSSIVEVSANDTLKQCYPAVEDLRRGVVNIALQRDYIETIFIAADFADQDILDYALSTIDFGPLKVVTSYPKDVLGDAVEMQIMSQCDSVLVNRYSEHSQHVMELYLLQNKFNNDGVCFF